MPAVDDNLDLVRRGWEAAVRGDVETVAGLLAEDVRWHAAGDDSGGCQNRPEALQWMRAAIERGPAVEILEVQDLGENRVLVTLQRGGAPEAHAQVVTIRHGKIAEMVVYPTPAEALGLADV